MMITTIPKHFLMLLIPHSEHWSLVLEPFTDIVQVARHLLRSIRLCLDPTKQIGRSHRRLLHQFLSFPDDNSLSIQRYVRAEPFIRTPASSGAMTSCGVVPPGM